jgi:hypothetical protein
MLNTIKLSMLTVILIAGLHTGAAAQNMKTPTLVVDGDVITLQLRSIKVADGSVGFVNNFFPFRNLPRETLFGLSFLGRTTGDLTGSFALSLDCAPATFEPGGSNEFVGGSWMLPVYSNRPLLGTNYLGAIYGRVSGGKMSWDKVGVIAEVGMNFTVTGGTQTLSDLTGAGSFEGTLTTDEKGATLDGVLSINFY